MTVFALAIAIPDTNFRNTSTTNTITIGTNDYNLYTNSTFNVPLRNGIDLLDIFKEANKLMLSSFSSQVKVSEITEISNELIDTREELEETVIEKTESTLDNNSLVEFDSITKQEAQVEEEVIPTEVQAVAVTANIPKQLTQEQLDIVASALEFNFEYNGEPLTIPERFTETDLRILATMVYWECGKVQNDITVYFWDDYSNPQILPCHAMHQWTAQVCLNHLDDPRMPNNIYDNMQYPRYTAQYRTEEWTYMAQTENPEVWEDVVKDCLMAMNGLVEAPAGMIFQSNYEQLGTHFATVDVDTGWFRSRSFFAVG